MKNAFAANASRFDSPASSRKIVLIPQISDAASVLPSTSDVVGAGDGGGGGGHGAVRQASNASASGRGPTRLPARAAVA